MLGPRESKWILYTSILMGSLTQSPTVSLSLNLEDKSCINRQNGAWETGSAGGPKKLQLVVQSPANCQ